MLASQLDTFFYLSVKTSLSIKIKISTMKDSAFVSLYMTWAGAEFDKKNIIIHHGNITLANKKILFSKRTRIFYIFWKGMMS